VTPPDGLLVAALGPVLPPTSPTGWVSATARTPRASPFASVPRSTRAGAGPDARRPSAGGESGSPASEAPQAYQSSHGYQASAGYRSPGELGPQTPVPPPPRQQRPRQAVPPRPRWQYAPPAASSRYGGQAAAPGSVAAAPSQGAAAAGPSSYPSWTSVPWRGGPRRAVRGARGPRPLRTLIAVIVGIMVLAGVLNGVLHPSSHTSSSSSSSGVASAPQEPTLLYTALPNESLDRRGDWETTCRDVTLKELHLHARWLKGQSVDMDAVVDFVYNEPNGSYRLFPHMYAASYAVVSLRRETTAKPDQVVIAFSRHAPHMPQGETITVWGTAEGRVTMKLSGGGHLSVPWVEARYVVRPV
jgi:hypothetical protein